MQGTSRRDVDAGAMNDDGASEVQRWLEARGPPGQRMTRRFTLHAAPHVHSMDLTVRYDARGDLETLKLHIGGDGKRDCVDMLVKRREEVANLVEVKHHPGCAVGRDFARGGSRRMLRAAFECVRRLAPWVTTIHLWDKSFVPCDATTVSLAPLYIIKCGQTWYEHHFGAHVGHGGAAGAEHRAYRRAVDALMRDTALKARLSWDAFCDAYGVDPDHHLLRHAYESADTFGAFFDAVQAATAARGAQQAFCAAVAPWAERLVEAHTAMGPRLASWIRQPWFVDLPRDAEYEPHVSVQARAGAGGGAMRLGRPVRVSQTEARASRDAARMQLALEDAVIYHTPHAPGQGHGARHPQRQR